MSFMDATNNFIKIIGFIFLGVGIIFIIITFTCKKKTVGRISVAISCLSLILTALPYFYSIPIGNENTIALYYGNIDKINEMQNNYVKITDENYKLKETITEQDKKIQNLKTLLNDPSKSNVLSSEHKIDFKDISNILYSGVQYIKYDGNNSNESFSVAGKDYRVGFVLQNDGSLFSIDDPGYVLFNLEEKYSKMICNVGRMNGNDNETLYITSSDNFIDMKFDVKVDAASQILEIPLNYAKDLKIALNTGMSVRYGFYNIVFYE